VGKTVKRLFYNEQFMLKILIIMSVMMFLSLFTLPKIAAIGMTIWIINIGWIMHLLTRGRISEMPNCHEERIENAKKNKNYFEFGIRSIALPLCVVGLIVVVVNLIVLFNM
jgi:hypothetical protein